MDPRTIYDNSTTPSMAYSNCQTRIIDLSSFEIPDSATEEEYKTLYESISASNTPESKLLTDAVNSVAYGIAPPVAFPTETVYGLGADATNRASISGIFAAKGRPSDNPLIVHVASQAHLQRLTGQPIPEVYKDLVQEHWPGPLTILVPVPIHSVFAENVHPGQKTIGFRVPRSKYARFFIAATDRPIAAPSANSSGRPSPTLARHVMRDLQGRINFILDGGSCDVGVESTVVDGLCDPPLILRPGGISQDALIAHGKKYGNAWSRTGIGYKDVAHDIHRVHPQSQSRSQLQIQPQHDQVHSDPHSDAPRAPGMKYKHYAPQGQLILLQDLDSHILLRSEIDSMIDALGIKGDDSNSQGNGQEDSAHPTQDITSVTRIAILRTTSWPPFAGLEGSSISSSGVHPAHAIYRNHTVYDINLGQTPRQIAHSLFAALRTCDDLGCGVIFAEEPVRPTVADGSASDEIVGELVDQHYDAVVERMRKAASRIM